MALRIHFKPRAALEVRRAATWWRENRSSAPEAVDTELRSALQRLAEQPGISTPVPSATRSGTRRLYLPRTRYFVYYRVEGSTLTVLAFWHASRENPPSA